MTTTSSKAPNADALRKFRYVVFAGLAFGVAVGVVIGLSTGSGYYGFHAGFFSGAAFGWGLKRFLKLSMSTTRLEVDKCEASFDDDETVVLHGGANHFKGIEAVGGKLLLTNKRLRFRSHELNVQAHDESYPVTSIHAVEPVRSASSPTASSSSSAMVAANASSS